MRRLTMLVLLAALARGAQAQAPAPDTVRLTLDAAVQRSLEQSVDMQEATTFGSACLRLSTSVVAGMATSCASWVSATC